jgi:hypothetical protein
MAAALDRRGSDLLTFKQNEAVLTDRARDLAVEMIRRLDWRDMELLTDMIFARGAGSASLHLEAVRLVLTSSLRSPSPAKELGFRPKPTSQREFEDYLDRFRREGSYQRFLFVYHTAATPTARVNQPNVHLWPARHVADAALRAGLLDWLSDRTLDGPAS